MKAKTFIPLSGEVCNCIPLVGKTNCYLKTKAFKELTIEHTWYTIKFKIHIQNK